MENKMSAPYDSSMSSGTQDPMMSQTTTTTTTPGGMMDQPKEDMGVFERLKEDVERAEQAIGEKMESWSESAKATGQYMSEKMQGSTSTAPSTTTGTTKDTERL